MNASSLIADLSKQDVRLWVRDGQLQYEGPEGAVTDDVLSKLRRNKAGILKHLAEISNPLEFCLDARHPDADEFPQFAAALKLGRLVLCRRCQHYDGPFERQLGWCRYHETEAAPDVPFRCEQHESRDGSAIG